MTTRKSSKKSRIEKRASPDSAGLKVLSRRVGYQLRRAHHVSSELFVQLISGGGIAPGQYGILKIIAASPGDNQKEVARLAGLDATTLVPIVEYLERQGWIRRVRSPRDRRHMILTITPSGRQRLKRLDALIEIHEDKLTEGLSQKERRTLLTLLSTISGVEVSEH